MMASFSDQANPGAFVTTTNIWDPAELYTIEVTSSEFKELMVRLYQNLNTMALNLNIRDAGYYSEEEFVNGQTYFPNPDLTGATEQTATFRQVFRKVINFGALPNTALKSVEHELTINDAFSFTRIYGTASDPIAGTYIPLPYAGANAIELNVNRTNINITTTSNRTAFTITYIVLEYIKS